MAKKATKQVEKNDNDDFFKSLSKDFSLKPTLIDEDLSSFVPWKVPFNHAGLQKITGGLLGGKIMLIEGESQTGKSWLLYELLANCIKMGGFGYLEDAERAFEPIYGKAAGMDFSKKAFLLNHEKVIESLHENFATFIKRVRDEKIKDLSIPLIVALDSTAPTRCRYQFENDEKGKESGHGWEKRANAMYEMVDKLTPVLDDYGASLVLIGQLRKNNRAGMFEDPTKGMMEELQYRSTQQLRGKRGSLDKDAEDKNLRKGMEVRWETYKNRFVKPKQIIKLKYDYTKGLHKYSGLLDLLVREKELIADAVQDGRSKIKGCTVSADPDKKFYALTDAKKMFEDFPHLLEPAYVKVHEVEENEEGIETGTDE